VIKIVSATFVSHFKHVGEGDSFRGTSGLNLDCTAACMQGLMLILKACVGFTYLHLQLQRRTEPMVAHFSGRGTLCLAHQAIAAGRALAAALHELLCLVACGQSCTVCRVHRDSSLNMLSVTPSVMLLCYIAGVCWVDGGPVSHDDTACRCRPLHPTCAVVSSLHGLTSCCNCSWISHHADHRILCLLHVVCLRHTLMCGLVVGTLCCSDGPCDAAVQEHHRQQQQQQQARWRVLLHFCDLLA
jgi:hypothetical protein